MCKGEYAEVCAFNEWKCKREYAEVSVNEWKYKREYAEVSVNEWKYKREYAEAYTLNEWIRLQTVLSLCDVYTMSLQ